VHLYWSKMKSSRAVTLIVLISALTLIPASLMGAPQRASSPAEGQVLHVLVGKSVVINAQGRLTRILASNPAAIETLATSPTEVIVEGKAAGTSSLILWDETGHSQMLDVVVDLDVSGLRIAIAHAYPDQQIEVQADAGRILLSGTVAFQRVADDLVKMATLYSPQVVNSLSVTVVRERQILLEVKFAEVDRSRVEQLGINIMSVGALNTVGSLTTGQFTPPTLGGATGGGGGGGSVTGKNPKAAGSFGLTDLMNIFLFRPDINLAATIKDLEAKSVLQILAEPNLLAMNGQKATFLAGGEFPFPVVQGGQNVGAVTIQFRPFGVRLEFTGEIGRDDVIRLHVAPEVSTLDFTNALTIAGFTVPAVSTRRAETEIELKDGQSFGIAGLLDHRVQTQLSKVPGIGDIPILGLLFRSKNVNRSNTELLVLVTPHIVDPVRAGSAAPSLPRFPIPYLNVPNFDDKLPGSKKPETSPQPPSPR
jgi:pilus assembly protein CpaC